MQDQQNNSKLEDPQDTDRDPLNTADAYQTPIDEENRKTGVAAKTEAKPTATQESGSSDPLVEGGGNQGTEKR